MFIMLKNIGFDYNFMSIGQAIMNFEYSAAKNLCLPRFTFIFKSIIIDLFLISFYIGESNYFACLRSHS